MAKRAQLDEVRPILNEVNEGIGAVEGVLDSVEAGADKATDILEHGLEKVADIVPEALDKSVHVAAETTRKGVRALQSPRKMILIFGLTGAVAGVTLGVVAYRLQKKALEAKLRVEFEAKLETEIEGMQKFFEKRASKKQPFSSPEKAVEALLPKTRETQLAEEAAAALNEYEAPEPPGIISPESDPREGSNQRVRYDKVERKKASDILRVAENPMEAVNRDASEEISHNVFVQQASLDDWDQEAEEANRHPESPYVISHDEFMENSYEHGQNTLVYYVGDDILVDEREQPIEEIEATVGVQNMQLFGHGSRDSSVVYVRNERIELDFEVTRNQGKYSEEVMGFRHSDLPSSRFRKGRRGDDG